MALNPSENPQFKQGYLYSIRLLAASRKSSHELQTRLLNKGYTPRTVREVLDELRAQGILNDQKLVHEMTQWARESKRYGRRRILHQLKKRGIPAQQIETSLAEYTEAEERATALSLARERSQRFAHLEPLKRKKRVYDFLINRGFDYELSRSVVSQINITSDANF